MDISVIAIGDELLIGQVVDTNSGTIAKIVNPVGWKIRSVRIVADDADDDVPDEQAVRAVSVRSVYIMFLIIISNC